jgi:hypothetical protein
VLTAIDHCHASFKMALALRISKRICLLAQFCGHPAACGFSGVRGFFSGNIFARHIENLSRSQTS